MPNAAEWESLYSNNRHVSVWPWTDVVSLTMRHFKPSGPEFRVLELGCGAGANIPFFRSLGVDYWAIEGSQSAIERLRQNYPDLAGKLMVGDFTQRIDPQGKFDMILDRGSLTHNQTSCLRKALKLIHRHLEPKGKLLCVDFFSTAFDEYREGDAGEDEYTRTNFSGGRLAGTGVAHFADEAHLLELFADFRIELLEHKTVAQRFPKPATFAAWNLIARPIGV